MDQDTWNVVNRLTMKKTMDAAARVRETWTRKFEKMHGAQHPPKQVLEKCRLIINLSSVPLDDITIEALTNRFNYAIASTIVPKEEIISALKTTYRLLPSNVADELRYKPVERRRS